MGGELNISLSAIAANYRYLCLQATGQVAAVVKADGYGLGAVPIARKLLGEGCREFFVATLTEGVNLRQAIPDAIIYVLEGAEAETVSELCRAELTPVLNTERQCQCWKTTGRSAAVHIDTGMQRLGLSPVTAQSVIGRNELRLDLVISHFARADETGHASLQRQVDQVVPIFRGLQAHFPNLRLSLCNSAALLQGLGPESLGRAGIGLYGANPSDQPENPMQSVVEMLGRVLQIRALDEGVAVGYGGSFVTRKKTRLAVLGVGYADGIPRLLSNRGVVALSGQRCPIVGRVSMDSMTVDVTGLAVAEGDAIEVIGSTVSVDEVAGWAQTISYEVLCGLSRRLPRHYAD